MVMAEAPEMPPWAIRLRVVALLQESALLTAMLPLPFPSPVVPPVWMVTLVVLRPAWMSAASMVVAFALEVNEPLTSSPLPPPATIVRS
jgi:hypothetical protein